MNASRVRRFRKRHAVALIAIVTELVAGLVWWRRRSAPRGEEVGRGEELSRDG